MNTIEINNIKLDDVQKPDDGYTYVNGKIFQGNVSKLFDSGNNEFVGIKLLDAVTLDWNGIQMPETEKFLGKLNEVTGATGIHSTLELISYIEGVCKILNDKGINKEYIGLSGIKLYIDNKEVTGTSYNHSINEDQNTHTLRIVARPTNSDTTEWDPESNVNSYDVIVSDTSIASFDSSYDELTIYKGGTVMLTIKPKKSNLQPVIYTLNIKDETEVSSDWFFFGSVATTDFGENEQDYGEPQGFGHDISILASGKSIVVPVKGYVYTIYPKKYALNIEFITPMGKTIYTQKSTYVLDDEEYEIIRTESKAEAGATITIK